LNGAEVNNLGSNNQEPKNSGKELTDSDLSASVISAAMNFHKALEPRFLESLCEEALCIEFSSGKIFFERQKSILLTYGNKPIKERRLDLFVEGKLVVELKACKELEPIHFSIVQSYMKATGVDSGLILNFAAMPMTIKRVGREYQSQDLRFCS